MGTFLLLIFCTTVWLLSGYFSVITLGVSKRETSYYGSTCINPIWVLYISAGFFTYIIVNIIGLFTLEPLNRKSNIKQIALGIIFPVLLLRTFIICPVISFFTEVKNSESINEFATKVREVLEYQPFIEDSDRKQKRLESKIKKLQIELNEGV